MRQKINAFKFLSFFLFLNAQAQNTAVFEGKQYLIYPQTIDNYSNSMYFDRFTLCFRNIDLPPIIGSIPDGEYLIYSKAYDLKNKRKVLGIYLFDTVFRVYATFNIKNNKKAGNAYLYSYNKGYHLKAVIPYMEDLIHGNIVYTVNFLNKKTRGQHRNHHYDFEMDEVDNLPRKNQIKLKASIYKIQFENGFVNGPLSIFDVYENDTVLTDYFTTENGVKQGQSKMLSYYRKGKKIFPYTELYGAYVDGKQEGKWISEDKFYNERQEKYYKAGVLGMIKNMDRNGNEMNCFLYGKDSVLKYTKGLEKESRYPNVYRNNMLNYIEFNVKNGKRTDFTYVLNDFHRYNFYAFTMQSNYRDSLINGKYYLFHTKYFKKGKNIYCYLIDSCNESTYKVFCDKDVWHKRFDNNGKETYDYKYKLYYQLALYDTLLPMLDEKFSGKRYEKERYYYKAINMFLLNSKFKTSRKQYSYIHFKVDGKNENTSVIKYLKFPISDDTLVLIDTLMKAGKYLYKSDKYYESVYQNYIFSEFDYERGGATSNIGEALMQFFAVWPEQHKSILIGKNQFTGELKLKIDYNRHPKHIKAKLYEVIEFFGISVKQVIEIELERNNKILKQNGNNKVLPQGVMECSLFDGVFSGSYSIDDVFGQTTVRAYYLSNMLNEDLRLYKYEISNKKWKKNVKMENVHVLKSSMISFLDGKKEGQWQINSYRTMENQLHFQDDKLNGLQYDFDRIYNYEYMSYCYDMKNDTVNGKVWRNLKSGRPYTTGQFKMGIPNGEFIEYSNRDTSKYYKQKYHFNTGYLSGKYEYYRDTNNLKFTIDIDIHDSIYFSIFQPIFQISSMRSDFDEEGYGENESNYYRFASYKKKEDFVNDFTAYTFLNTLFKQPLIKRGFYTHFYKSGTVFKEGFMKYNKPVGRWTFYREGKNRIYKTIDFKDSAIYTSGKDTLFTFGLVQAYYDDGKLMFKGYSTDKETKYTCESEADIPTEEDYYLQFFDTSGKQVIVNGNGFVTEYQASGHKLKEGQIVNNQKQGVWIYYNNFGQAVSIGFYENGKKTGRWLSGDLSGLNLSDKLCFMSNEEYFDWIKIYGGFLDLTEEFYNNGNLINKNTVETIKR